MGVFRVLRNCVMLGVLNDCSITKIPSENFSQVKSFFILLFCCDTVMKRDSLIYCGKIFNLCFWCLDCTEFSQFYWRLPNLLSSEAIQSCFILKAFINNFLLIFCHGRIWKKMVDIGYLTVKHLFLTVFFLSEKVLYCHIPMKK